MMKEQRTSEANPAGENSSFVFTVCVKSVSLYHFKLAYHSSTFGCERIFENSLLKKEK